MTDDTEQVFRSSIAELVRDRPPLGPIDVNAVVRAADSPRHRLGTAGLRKTAWGLVAAAVVVVLAGVGGALWFGRGLPAVPAGSGSLSGTRWLATQIQDSRVVVDSGGHVPYLAFGSDDKVTGGDPCNRISGGYRLSNQQLSLNNLVTTEIACENVAQQSEYGLALDRVREFRHSGATLTLLDGQGRTVLVFRAAAGATDAVKIRVRNDTKVGFDSVRVTFPVGNVGDYGALAAGAESDYVVAGESYRYAAIKVVVDGTESSVQPTDYVGETTLPDGYYTYALSFDNGSLELTFESDQ